MSTVIAGDGRQDMILGLIWGGTPHIRIGWDTAHYSESEGRTPHKKMCSDIFSGVGTPHTTPHTTQSQGEHRTRKGVQIFILGWGHRT